jgi:hypothetical protein
MEGPDNRFLISGVLLAFALGDLLLIPVLRTRIQGPGQPLVLLGMLSSSILMVALAAAFWWRVIPV